MANTLEIPDMDLKSVLSNLDLKSEHAESFEKFVQSASVPNNPIIDQLLDIVKSSRFDLSLSLVSSNAITILNRSKFNFSGLDLRNILIQGADLSNSICASTDFRGADLTNVNFTNSWLVGANFKGANLSGIDFGEELRVICPELPMELASYEDSSGNPVLLTICQKDSKVHCWNFNTGTEMIRFSLGHEEDFRFRRDFKVIRLQDVAVGAAVKTYLAVKFYRSIEIWDLNIRKCVHKIDVEKVFSLRPWHWDDPPDYDETRLEIDGQWLCLTKGKMLKIAKWERGSAPRIVFEQVQVASQWFAGVALCGQGNLVATWGEGGIEIRRFTRNGDDVVVSEPFATVDPNLSQPVDRHSIVNVHFEIQGRFLVYVTNDRTVVNLYSVESQTISEFNVNSTFVIPDTSTFVITDIVFNSDATILAVANGQGYIYTWDIQSRHILQEFTREFGRNMLCFHPSKPVLAGSRVNDQELKFWKLTFKIPEKGESSEAKVTPPTGNILKVAVSLDHKWLATVHSTDPLRERFSNSKSREEYLLKFWGTAAGSAPTATELINIGRFAGTSIGLEFIPDTGNKALLVVAGLQAVCTDCANDVMWRRRQLCIAQGHISFVVSIYDTRGQVLKKQILEHEPWNGNGRFQTAMANFIYTSALHMKGTGYQLASPLWDGCVQLWSFDTVEHVFNKSRVLISNYQVPVIKEREEDVIYFHQDLWNGAKFRFTGIDWWDHVEIWFLADSTGKEWVITSNTSKEVKIWNPCSDEKHIPVYMLRLTKGQVSPHEVYFDSDTQIFYAMCIQIGVWKLHHQPKKCRFLVENLKVSAFATLVVKEKHFDWILAACEDLRIYKLQVNSDNEWNLKLVGRIPLWFVVHLLEYFQSVEDQTQNQLNLIVGGGFSNLAIFQFKPDYTWKLVQVLHRGKNMLMAQNVNFNQCVNLSDWSYGILRSFGAVGVPAPSSQTYYPQAAVIKVFPAPGSQGINVSSILDNRNQHGLSNFQCSDSIWVVSILGYQSRTRSFKSQLMKNLCIRHTFVLLEGLMDNQLFIFRADLKTCTHLREQGRVIVLHSYLSLEEANADLQRCEGIQWEIGHELGKKLIQNIRNEQQEHWDYHLLVNNCITWCLGHLQVVGVPISYSKLLTTFPNRDCIK